MPSALSLQKPRPGIGMVVLVDGALVVPLGFVVEGAAVVTTGLGVVGAAVVTTGLGVLVAGAVVETIGFLVVVDGGGGGGISVRGGRNRKTSLYQQVHLVGIWLV